jgi:hypothetical protein
MTGKGFGYDVVGDYKTCEDYSVAKARQKDINKDLKGSSITPGEDSTWISTPSRGKAMEHHSVKIELSTRRHNHHHCN